jgi:hypothetical protein
MSDCKIAGYIPEIDVVRFYHEGTVYNIEGQVIADLWDAYVHGHGLDYDICADCELTEQEHGRWVEDTLEFNGVALKVYRCTACGEPFWTNPPGYCPNCGAKMDEPAPGAAEIINDGTYSAGDLYECDPEKNTECRKTGCYINGGECRHTTHAEYSRDDQE